MAEFDPVHKYRFEQLLYVTADLVDQVSPEEAMYNFQKLERARQSFNVPLEPHQAEVIARVLRNQYGQGVGEDRQIPRPQALLDLGPHQFIEKATSGEIQVPAEDVCQAYFSYVVEGCENPKPTLGHRNFNDGLYQAHAAIVEREGPEEPELPMPGLEQ